MKVVCITNDVEATTIQGGSFNDEVAKLIVNEGVPKTLRLYRDLGIKTTFFCLGSLIEKYPQIVKLIENEGHEIACHGWTHDGQQAFDILSLDKQIEHLELAKKTLETYTAKPVVSFRAPALRVNENTPIALEKSGFKYDSSISSQRIDAFMSLGVKSKLHWLLSPRSIYHTSPNNLAKKGDSKITEVPVSAFGLPYISTLIRISPFLTWVTRYLLYFETRRDNKKVVTFLFHPGEIMNHQVNTQLVKRSKNPIVQFFSGYLRAKLKNRNFGDKCEELMRREILFWQKKGYVFKRISDIEYLGE